MDDGEFQIGTVRPRSRSGAMNCATTKAGSGDSEVRRGPRSPLVRAVGFRGAGILGRMDNKVGFALRDAEYQRRVRESFERQGLMRHLGAELVSLEPGGAV